MIQLGSLIYDPKIGKRDLVKKELLCKTYVQKEFVGPDIRPIPVPFIPGRDGLIGGTQEDIPHPGDYIPAPSPAEPDGPAQTCCKWTEYGYYENGLWHTYTGPPCRKYCSQRAVDEAGPYLEWVQG